MRPPALLLAALLATLLAALVPLVGASPTGWKLNQRYAGTTCTGLPTVYDVRAYGECVPDWRTPYESYKRVSQPIPEPSGNYTITASFYNDTACTIQNHAPVTSSVDEAREQSCFPSRGYDARFGKRNRLTILSGPVPPLAPFAGAYQILSMAAGCATNVVQFVVFNPASCFESPPVEDDVKKSHIQSYRYSCENGGGSPALLSFTTHDCAGPPANTTLLDSSCHTDVDSGMPSYWACGLGYVPSSSASADAANAAAAAAANKAVWAGCAVALVLILAVVGWWISSQKGLLCYAGRAAASGGASSGASAGIALQSQGQGQGQGQGKLQHQQRGGDVIPNPVSRLALPA